MDIERSGFRSCRARRDADPVDDVLDIVRTGTDTLGISEVVVTRHVQALGLFSRELKGQIVVVGLSVEQGDVPPRDARCRSVETIIDPRLQTPDVEIVEIRIQRSVPVLLLQVSIPLLGKPFAEEIADVTENDEDEVGDVRGDQVIIWWLLLYVLLGRSIRGGRHFVRRIHEGGKLTRLLLVPRLGGRLGRSDVSIGLGRMTVGGLLRAGLARPGSECRTEFGLGQRRFRDLLLMKGRGRLVRRSCGEEVVLWGSDGRCRLAGGRSGQCLVRIGIDREGTCRDHRGEGSDWSRLSVDFLRSDWRLSMREGPWPWCGRWAGDSRCWYKQVRTSAEEFGDPIAGGLQAESGNPSREQLRPVKTSSR